MELDTGSRSFITLASVAPWVKEVDVLLDDAVSCQLRVRVCVTRYFLFIFKEFISKLNFDSILSFDMRRQFATF